MKIYLLVDFGSTYTKITAVDLDTEAVMGRAQSPTTVETDISIGYHNALENLRQGCAFDDSDVCGRYACSSAAGGLKMAAIGLVPDLTLNAARRAALGAGAKVVGAYGYEIDDIIVGEIEDKNCDIVMLCGGTNGGNKNVILHNASMLAKSRIDCPILVCGNNVVSGQIKSLLEDAGKKAYVAKNVLPSVTEIDVEPAQNCIREIFIEHIIRAKGFENVEKYFDNPIIPTPKASLNAAELLADGTREEPGIGSLLVIEVGGATTNIHSVANIVPFSPETIVKGLPESRVSRTVEGDLGIRYNARTIFDLVGEEKLTRIANQMPMSSETYSPNAYTSLLNENVEHVPADKDEGRLDIALAAAAVEIAVERHAGTIKNEFGALGQISIQYGRNLLNVENLIGTGGIFKYGTWPEIIFKSALFSEQNPWSLKPRAPKAYIDADYLFYAMGLLSSDFPDEALRIMKKHIKRISLDQ